MKKFLIAGTILLLAASNNAFAESKNYFRIDIGSSWVKSFNEKVEGSNNIVVPWKAKSHFVGSFGVGNYLTDHTRIEFFVSHHFKPKYRSSADFISLNPDDGELYHLKGSGKAEILADSVMLRLQEDFLKFDQGNFFAGAGIGISKLQARYSYSGSITRLSDGSKFSLSETETVKVKYNPSFHLTAGMSFNLSEKAKLDIAYSYNDLGKTKADEDGDRIHFRPHIVSCGIRVEN